MVILQANGSNCQPSINILLWAVAYDTVWKQNVLPLWEMKREFMMILKQNKIKLANEDTTTTRNSDSTSRMYLTAVKVAQCRQVADNRREKEEAKKVTAKKTSTRKVHIQLKRYEDFDRCINSMHSLSSSTTDEERLIQLFQQSPNTIKDGFLRMGGKLA